MSTPEFRALMEMQKQNLSDEELVQKAWEDLVYMIQPGGMDGMDAQADAVKSGPPEQPNDVIKAEMRKAYNDDTKIIFDPGEDQVPDYIPVWDVVVQGLAYDGTNLIGKHDAAYVRRTYRNFVHWTGRVFPG